MIDEEKKAQRAEEKNRTRKRMRATVDPDKYEYIPAEKSADFYDSDVQQRVLIYVRVSTDDVRQTTSFELQKKYYEDYVRHHDNWELVEIYADEGISGTSRVHRTEFNRMIEDAKAGKGSLIITKSVSRFARNVVDCISIVRELAERKNPVGVFFESECIFSLNEDSQMALSFVATMAEEESHTRSRSMESSLRMRLDNGIPLTPKLLGYTHDSEGNLIINPEEAPTVKLVFYMYLYGYSTQQIADALIALERKSYLGNTQCWTPTAIVQILRNERHCGDVLTRKTYTPNYRDHKSKRNVGKRPQSHYIDHHEAIISRDDFIAVQNLLNNARFRNKSFLPELRVIDSGILKGYVIINPRWAGFQLDDYYKASRSAYQTEEESPGDSSTQTIVQPERQIELNAGDFDLRGFEITRSEFFDFNKRPTVSFQEGKITFNTECTRKFPPCGHIEMLVHPFERKLAIRGTTEENRNGILISKYVNGKPKPRQIAAAPFFDMIYRIFSWNTEFKYRIIGSLYETDTDVAFVFDAANSEAFFKSYLVTPEMESDAKPFTPTRTLVRGIPENWTTTFGTEYYLHEQTLTELASQSAEDWQLRIEGQLFETGKRLNVTSFDVLKGYIQHELNGLTIGE